MAFGIKLKVWGDYALFTRPEMKAERISYDVPTPCAARGIIEAIYWKPQIRWVIDRVHVLNPIRFTSIRRNELASQGSSGHKVSSAFIRKAEAMNGSHVGIGIDATNDKGKLLYRQQRTSLLLLDVAYVFEAHFEILDFRFEKNGPELSPKDCEGKHISEFNRRAIAGKFHHAPCLGCREFLAFFELLGNEPVPRSALADGPDIDLGFMLYDIDFKHDNTPCFYRPVMQNGVIEVQHWWNLSPSNPNRV
jgi:CRISPR-associated protein Cas5d